LLVAGTTVHARINVVTLPDRDTVQLTIYNSADLTLVKETLEKWLKNGAIASETVEHLVRGHEEGKAVWKAIKQAAPTAK